VDTGKGYFEMMQAAANAKEAELVKAAQEIEAKHPNHGGWFRPGEVIEIRGSRFRIKTVSPTEIRLKLLTKG